MRKSFLPSRVIARRRDEEPSAWDVKLHLSTSLESSRRWYTKQITKQIQQGGLFTDPFLSADSNTIGSQLCSAGRRYEWLRPYDISRSPMFVSDGISRFDVKQGEIGNCWFLAAVASLSGHEKLLKEVIPAGQSFDKNPENSNRSFPYCGMFWFRIWRFGDWYDVVVDDQLPTRNRRMVFMHSSDRDEFWSALLEKAFVKLFGTYDAMRGGCTAEAMEDLTGGLTEVVDLGDATPPKLFSIMESANARDSLMGCSIDTTGDEIEGEGPMGLITGHAYSVTSIQKVDTSQGMVQMIRLRNPWGNEKEWTGPWSDQSELWRKVSSSERHRIGFTTGGDGEFWMAYSDFTRHFSRLEFCHLGPESGAYGQSRIQYSEARQWEMTRDEGEWVRFSTAGGCRNYDATFHKNPQFRVTVIDPDETDQDNMGTIIVGLMQKGWRETQQELHTIGYAIYRLPTGNNREGLLGRAFFLTNNTTARSPTFTNMREVVGRHKLQPGEYVIIPSTFAPNQEAKFMLRIFSERACDSKEMDDSTLIEKKAPTPSRQQEEEALVAGLKSAFRDIAGKAGVLTYSLLQDILNAVFSQEFRFDGFSSEACRSMVALMDIDLSGSLDFEQFKRLWMNLRIWKTVFKMFDRDGNCTLNGFELRDILKTIGFSVSNRVNNAIIYRYANKNGEISFDDYILLLTRLMTVVDTYKSQERLADGRAVFDLEEFARSIIYI